MSNLTAVFRDVFDDDTILLRKDTTARDVDGWNSLAHIRLMLSIEDAFNLRFDAGEISDMKNVGDLVKVIVGRARGI